VNPERFNELTTEIGAPASVARRGYLLSVITVHGVLTTGKWQKDFAPIASDNLIRAEHVDYSYRFPALRPNRQAEAASTDFMQLYMEQRRQWGLPMSAVGHSFGTLVIGRTLELNPYLKLERLILSASILACSFPWSDVVPGRVGAVMNEHCPKDRVVPLSQSWKFLGVGTGKSGNKGFDNVCSGAVANVHYKHVGHNKLITRLHMEDAWVPFLLTGKIPSGDPKPAQKARWWRKN
jgi:hypothetical protein